MNNTLNDNLQNTVHALGKSLHDFKNETKSQMDKLQQEDTKKKDDIETKHVNHQSETNIHDTVNSLQNSFAHFTNQMEEKMNTLYKSQDNKNNQDANQTTNPKNDIPATWGDNTHMVKKNLSQFIFDGSFDGMNENKLTNMGRYVCINHLNQFIASTNAYSSPIRELSSVFHINQGDKFDLMLAKQPNVSNSDINEASANAVSRLAFDKITIDIHAFDASFNIPHHLTYGDRPLNYEDSIINNLANAIATKERELFITGLDQKIESIVPQQDDKLIKEKFSYDALLKMMNTLNPEFEKDAVWLMTREMYTKCLQMTDSSGRHLITMDSQNLNEYLLGRKIHFMPELKKSANNCQLMLCNLAQGYAIVEYKELLLLQDSLTYKPDIQVFVRKNMGAKVVDANAFVGFVETSEAS